MITLLAFLLPVFSYAEDANTIQVMNHGVAAFQKRFDMIERAQKSIDVEYFIYNTDEAGRLFTQALIKKKLENPTIQIRIIVDASATVLQLKDEFSSIVQKYGIEVRHYNPISLIRHFKKAQYRDHRKLIVVDGKEAITGSRNIADEYFDMHKEFNFRDRDIWVEGPIVDTIQQSFDDYWNNEQTFKAPKKRITVEAKDFVTENAHDVFLRGEIKQVGGMILRFPNSTGKCESLSYVTDMPGFPQSDRRKVFPKILERMNEMQEGEKLYVESPYFIVEDKPAFHQMANLKSKNISAVLLTNSLASTDAFYVAANFYPQTSFYQKLADSKMYIYSGDTPVGIKRIKNENGEYLTKNATWGIHSKTFVFNDTDFAIGTFNVDPRSANLNSEMMMFCEGSKTVADYVKNDIFNRIDQSTMIDKNGELANGKSIFDGVGILKQIKFFAAILPSDWFSYLL